MIYPCEIQERPAQPTLTVRFRAPVQDLPMHFGRIYGLIGQYLGQIGAQPVDAPFAIYYNLDMQNLDIEAGFPVVSLLPGSGEIQASEIPGGTFAVCHFTGPYDAMMPGYDALTEFARASGYAPSGIVYEYYLTEADVPPQDIRTDIVFPVMRVGAPAAP